MLGTLLIASLVSGRPILAALAAPFAAMIALSVASSRSTSGVQLRLPTERVCEDDTISVEVLLEGNAAHDLCAVRLAGADFDSAPDSPAWAVLHVASGERRASTLTVSPKRWGRAQLGPVTVVQRSALLHRSEAGVTGQTSVNVYPRAMPLQPEVAIPRSRAYAGSHPSRMTGPGVQFNRLRLFQPGDNRRSVNWRATARRRELVVNVTDTDLAADVVLAVDALYDIPGAAADAGSSLDISVRAMNGLLEHYVSLGDRVGLLEWSVRQRVLRPGAGRGQLVRGRDWLLDVERTASAAIAPLHWPVEFAAMTPLTIVFTPLVEEVSLGLVAGLRRRGLPVVAVDTLPAGVFGSDEDFVRDITRRLWLLRRDQQIARLAEIGAPVVSVRGDQSLARVVGDLARLAAAPRLALR